MKFSELNKASAATKTIGSYSFYEMSEETPIDYTDCFTWRIVEFTKNNVYSHSEAYITGLTEKGKTLEYLETPQEYQGFPVTTIETFALLQASNLKSIKIKSMRTIESGAFAYSGLINIELPEGLQVIDSNAFSNTQLVTLIIPLSVNKVGYAIFKNCKNLTTIYCKVSEKPAQWDNGWNALCDAQIVWGYTGT